MLSKIRSLAYRTDLSLINFTGKIERRDGYYFVQSPNNPGFFWGNILLMDQPPKSGDLERWTNIFKNEFAHEPKVKHMTFGWDSPEGIEGDTADFVRDGFEVEKSIVLKLIPENLKLPKFSNEKIVVRPVKGDEDWEQVVLNQVRCRSKNFEYEPYLKFKRVRMKNFRSMTEAGLGNWFGAFMGETLLGDCGVFAFEGVGRFQSVETHPDFRNQGICGNLVYQVCKFAFEKMNAYNLIMVADPEYHAAKVYESVGFHVAERQIGVYKWPKEEWTKI